MIFLALLSLLFHEMREVMEASVPVVKFVSDGRETTFDVEVADNAVERARGLMFRTKMEEKHGMIFLFDDERLRNFWMKNTLIPLDMIFADKDGKIVRLLKDVPPCDERVTVLCPLYSSLRPAKYVVELNAGTAEKYGIQGDARVILPAQ